LQSPQLSGHVDRFIEIDKQLAVQMVKKKKDDDEQVLRLLMCALTCFDDVLTETTRKEGEEKNRSFTLRSVSLPYVWLNIDIYKKNEN
jgi:hypothetical protein